MKILNWNIVSFKAIIKKDNVIDNKKSKNNTFQNFVIKNDFDILCLQELKLNDCNLDILDDYFPEYEYKYVNIPHVKKGYSGVAVVSKYKAINIIDTLIVDGKEECEGRFICLEFEKFYLINIYAANAGEKLKRLDYKNNFNQSLYKMLNKLKQKKEVMILGDFNAVEGPIGSYNFDKQYNKIAGVTKDEIEFLNKLINNGYNNVFREIYKNKIQYSYFSYRTKGRIYGNGMLIDHVLTTDKILKKIKNVEYMNTIYGSDHLPIKIELDI
jgi:exodeoxyribonuclease-3